MISFGLSDSNLSSDELKVSRSIIYRKEAPTGEYHSILTVLLITRKEVQLTPRVDIHRAILAFTVSEGNFCYKFNCPAISIYLFPNHYVVSLVLKFVATCFHTLDFCCTFDSKITKV